MAGEHLVGLDDRQLAVVCAPLGPVAVLAGPGSGKTRTLVARIVELVSSGQLDAGEVLALTHTSKAAGELSHRLARFGVPAACSTVHAAAWRSVRRWHAPAGWGDPPQLLPSLFPVVRGAVRSVCGDADSGMVSDVCSDIDLARARLLGPDALSCLPSRSGLSSGQLADVWELVEREKRRAGVVDFSDVLELAGELAREGFGPHHTLSGWFIDEFQDIDLAQMRLVELWLGDRRGLCVVGDPDQAIFGFKGGDSTLLTGFSSRFPDASLLWLNDNYRSSPQVVDWVNALRSPQRPELVSRQPPGPPPSLTVCDSEDDEEAQLVAQLSAWHGSGVAWQEMAVLFRFNATSARVEAALTRAAIPHAVAGSERFFDRPEVRALLVPFGRAARSAPDVPGRPLLVEVATAAGFDPASPPPGAGVARQRWEAQAALLDFVADDGRGAQTVLADLQHRAREAHDLTPGGVALCSIHAAKGLEWDAVWLVGASEGQMPSVFAKTEAELAEERHLMYVALSRARRCLVVSHAHRRRNGRAAKPSRYLDLLTASARPGSKRTAAVAVPAAGRRSSVAVCEVCRGELAGAAARKFKRCSARCLDGPAKERFERLLDWRSRRAAELQLLEQTLASDRALFIMSLTASARAVPGLDERAGIPPL